MLASGIRVAGIEDADAVRSVHLAAFPAEESEQVAKLATDLLLEAVEPPVVSLVAERAGNICGHVAFSPVGASNDASFTGYILAPLGVMPAVQHTGLGAALVEAGLGRLPDGKADVVFVYGDPAYYGRFGFAAGQAGAYLPPFELEYPFGWQALTRVRREADTPPVRLTFVASLSDPALW